MVQETLLHWKPQYSPTQHSCMTSPLDWCKTAFLGHTWYPSFAGGGCQIVHLGYPQSHIFAAVLEWSLLWSFRPYSGLGYFMIDLSWGIKGSKKNMTPWWLLCWVPWVSIVIKTRNCCRGLRRRLAFEGLCWMNLCILLKTPISQQMWSGQRCLLWWLKGRCTSQWLWTMGSFSNRTLASHSKEMVRLWLEL